MPSKFSHSELLKLLVDRLGDFVVVLLDIEGRFASWHPGVEKQLGYTADEFIGQPGELLLPLSDRLKGAFRRELETAKKYGRCSDTTWLVTKTGRPIFVEGVSISLRDPESDELLGFGKILRDVTERKNTEDNLTTLTKTLDQSVVFITSWDGLIQYWTAGCEALYGWSREEAQGRHADDLLQTLQTIPYEVIQTQLRATGTWKGELQQNRKDGTPVYVSAHWTMLLQGAEKKPSIIATHTDISSRLQMQIQLEQANEQLKKMALELERSNSELEEFARIASHDLSAPITSTRWLVDLLANRHSKALDTEGQKLLGQIAQGLERMINLVEAILAHARAGINPIGTSTLVNAEEALAIATQNLSKDLNLSGAKLSHNPLPKLYIEIHALAQLFQNLLSNAIKYRRADIPVRIHVEAVRQDRFWRISVADNGMGIEPGWLERIFQPMQRPNRPSIAGSGIGLATCRKIVNRAGGKIWAESELGVGSTFYFTLLGSDD